MARLVALAWHGESLRPGHGMESRSGLAWIGQGWTVAGGLARPVVSHWVEVAEVGEVCREGLA